MSECVEKSLMVKIQYFADLLNANILEIESALISLDMSKKEENEAYLKSEVYQKILSRYEDLFEDVIYKEE